MILPTADIVALRRQLGDEIDRALRTSDHIGTSTVSCHLQMARDMLGKPAEAEAAGRPANLGGTARRQ
jgi:hypothetical protein